LVLALASTAQLSLASDWNRFRGENGSGISTDDQPVPVSWSATENLKWKAELPQAGRIFT
jgi:hypothetical protein